MKLHCVAVLLLLFCPCSKADWCYTEPSCGPITWTSLGFCNGTRQSPIDIEEASVHFNGSLGQLVFTNYSNKDALQTLSNTGHTVEVSISDGVSVSGGGLPATYIATAFHFHWGNGTNGSEHRLMGRQYPMEMHIIHTKGGISLSAAKQDPSGIAVLGFFIDAVDSANKSQLALLSELLEEVSSPGMKLQLNSSFSLKDLLEDANLTMFYRYLGSLTTPTCDEAVLWSVFKTPITVPSSVVKAFSSALKQNASGNMEILQNNFRSPQPLNGRNVQASFQSSVPVSPNSTAASTVPSSSEAVLPASVLSTMIMALILLTQ
ncbi:carbonic anhydrase 4-like [Anomaloglossus baeobatrachus]